MKRQYRLREDEALHEWLDRLMESMPLRQLSDCELRDELLSGNAVQIAGLGTFKLKVSGKTHANLADVTSQGCTIAVIFDPDTELTQRLNNEHQFQFVTKPTAEGEQDVNTDNNTTDQKPGSGSDTSDPGQEA